MFVVNLDSTLFNEIFIDFPSSWEGSTFCLHCVRIISKKFSDTFSLTTDDDELRYRMAASCTTGNEPLTG